jgi:hypothetical protein
MDKGETIMPSFYDSDISVNFSEPVEIKKNRTYVIRNLGGELPKNIIEHILKHLQEQTKAKFIILQGRDFEIKEKQ